MKDVLAIEKEELPLIVFSDSSSGFIQWIIKARTKGTYNHVMWAHKSRKFASQGNIYSEVPFGRYEKYGNRLKFLQIKGLTFAQKKMIVFSIENKLKLPWHKRLYDWFGVIIGQAVGLKGINTPWLDYCSEDVPQHLKENKELLKSIGNNGLRDFIDHIPKHGSPEDLNKYFKQNPDYTMVYAKWDSDD